MHEKIEISIVINASPEMVWEGLTDPQLVKQYFFGTELSSDWKKGSSITFRGQWDGKTYEDKGIIQDITPAQHLTYKYWSSFSNVPDSPENYLTISYDLQKQDKGTCLVVTQETTPQQKEHSIANWQHVLAELKKLIESIQVC